MSSGARTPGLAILDRDVALPDEFFSPVSFEGREGYMPSRKWQDQPAATPYSSLASNSRDKNRFKVKLLISKGLRRARFG
jgi:hypothetical protein